MLPVYCSRAWPCIFLARSRCTIESSPAVFTELISEIGVPNVQVEELYALDPTLFRSLQPIHGLVFLFRYRPDEAAKAATRPGTVFTDTPAGLFFAHQVIQNACATQALLSILLNAPAVSLGQELSAFREFTADFDPTTKGLSISNSDVLRDAHNAFSPQQFVVENAPDLGGEKEPPYHFISFVPKDGRVYELDGLSPGPRGHGTFDPAAGPAAWLDVVTPVIESRMAEYAAEGEIRFTLLAVCDDIAARLTRELEALPADADAGLRAELVARKDQEESKRAGWKKENARRKHNWVPFIVEMLRACGAAGKMDDIIKDATERKKTRLEAEKIQGKKESGVDGA